MTNPTVRGDRICRCCKGYCHDGSWRSTYGQRKGYWCSLACLMHDKPHLSYHPDGDIFKSYEPVDVISK